MFELSERDDGHRIADLRICLAFAMRAVDEAVVGAVISIAGLLQVMWLVSPCLLLVATVISVIWQQDRFSSK